MSIGENIKEARKKKGYTQAQLGVLMEYEGRTGEVMVQHWENDRQLVPVTKLRKLAELLDMKYDDLIP